ALQVEGFHACLADKQSAGLLIGKHAEQWPHCVARVDPLRSGVSAAWDSPDAVRAPASNNDGSVGSRSDALRKKVLAGNRNNGRFRGIQDARGHEDDRCDPREYSVDTVFDRLHKIFHHSPVSGTNSMSANLAT